MKKSILIISTLAVVAAGVFTGCTKKQFDDKFNDPEKSTVATIDGLYSGLFSNRRVFPDYWHTRTILAEITGRYTQTVGFLPDAGMYEPNPSYVQDRWNDLYTAPGTPSHWTAPIANFREMEKIYNGLEDEAEKQGYLLFMETARIFLYDQATRSVDLWGDIPFSKAGLLNLNGSLELASYDNAAAIYDEALTNLKRISDWLASVQPDPFYMSTLGKHDMLCKGDLLKWRRYANSLILRLAMRISYVQEDRARQLVQEILSNPTKYPVVEVFTDNVELTAAAPNRVTDLFTAWNENDGNLAPGYLVDSLMKPSGDPRLRLLYTTNRNGDYQGIAPTWTNAQAAAAVSAGLISRLDTVTFTRNASFPGIVMTASEVWFLKAEAFQRWTGGIARNAYENGIRQSINYYYEIHKRSVYGVRETAPTDAEFTLLIAHPLVAYGTDPESNLNKIALQKWLSFGPMQSDQTWAEMRRSGYPKISVPTDVSSQILPTPPARLLYPSTERNLNDKNYEAVAGKDKYDTKIFWAR